jgi:hypothetical protein
VLKKHTGVPAGIQALEAVGMVTTDDYKRVFAPPVDQARRTGSRMRLLYQFGPHFARITPGALWADTRLGVGYLGLLDACAVVSERRLDSDANLRHRCVDAMAGVGVRQRPTR